MRRNSAGLLLLRRGFSSKLPSVAPVESQAEPATAASSASPPTLIKDAVVKKLPYYRKIHRHHEPRHLLQEEFPNAGDVSGAGARLHDYQKTGELAARLSNIAERIDFVSPYERPWNRAEKTWRRDWHPTLLATRKAWAVPAVPAYFDPLHFYQYITKTRVERGVLDDIYKGIVLPYQTFNTLLEESLRSHLDSPHVDTEGERTTAVLASCLDDAFIALSHARAENLAQLRVAYNSQCESFWIRAGFMFLYDVQQPGDESVERKLWNAAKFIGDDRRKLGELAFVHRDRLAASVRSRRPLRPLLCSRDSPDALQPLFDHPFDAETDLYSPKVFNLWPDENPLWQCPGFFPESAEPHPHTRLGLKSLAGLTEKISSWAMQGEEAAKTLEECGTAQAVASLFSLLSATAHIEGFTQYNDVTRPFCSQLALSDGRTFLFAVGQLNTLAININVEGFHNPLVNLARVEGPFNLYDKYEGGQFWYLERNENGEEKEVPGLNRKVLERLLQMIYVDA